MKHKAAAILIMILGLILPQQVFAAMTVASSSYYVSYLDQYRIDYTIVTASTNYQLHFTSPSGEVFTGNYNFRPTGIHYLTCNGTYKLNFYDSLGVLIAQTASVKTTVIANPTCSSYPDDVSGADDLGGNATTIGDDRYRITWGNVPGASGYQIWKDGNLVTTTSGTTYEGNRGSYSVVALDSSGQPVGRSDLVVPKAYSECCQWLAELLQCPDWDTIMGELTEAIKAALPPPPDWPYIADLIGEATIRHLDNYLGPVPAAPSLDEIVENTDTSLPDVDISGPADNLVPTVPNGYEQPKSFDITGGPQIEVVDESKPFQIFEPLHNIEYDTPGVPVIPGDPRNNNGGIVQPTNITIPMPMPSNLSPNPIDPTPAPTPTTGSIPIPTISPSDIPIPNIK